MKSEGRISTPADAAALIWAALPKEQREERVFVLPLDSHGKVLAKRKPTASFPLPS